MTKKNIDYNQYGYNKDPFTALDAITEAQKIAFSPILFQAIISIRDLGILNYLDKKNNQGATFEELNEHFDLSPYAIQILLDVALSMHVIYFNEDRYILAKIGYFLLHDEMTKVNLDFTNDVCYESMTYLLDSLKTGKPAGLKVFGDSETIYPLLSTLPTKAKKSWFAFDHYYSDNSFPKAFEYIKDLSPKHIYDFGGNTGKWAIYCATQDPNLKITIFDLPEQTQVAKKNITNANLDHQIFTHSTNLLETKEIPNEADIYWMSQFLDCFSENQILSILKLMHQNMNESAKLCIMDIFWDKQKFEAGALSLNASSLYFTCLANGNSRFYHSSVFIQCLNQAGFIIEEEINNIGIGHTLLICKKH